MVNYSGLERSSFPRLLFAATCEKEKDQQETAQITNDANLKFMRTKYSTEDNNGFNYQIKDSS